MQIIFLILSLIHTPYIKLIEQHDNYFCAKIFVKDRQCGTIYIIDDVFQYTISCGFNLGKGSVKLNEIKLIHKEGMLILFHYSDLNKKLLFVKCPVDVFEHITLYISQRKYLQPKKER